MTEGAQPIDISLPSPNVVAVVGEIDAHTAPALAAALEAITDSVVVDMAGVEFIDSSGLRVLLEAHQTRSATGGRVVLREPSEVVQRLLTVAGLDGHFGIEPA